MTERPQTAPHPGDPRPNDPRRSAPRATEQRPSDQRPTDQRRTDRPDGRAPSDGGSAAPSALLSDRDLETVTRRWHEIQAGFVDAPQQAVKDADALVADLMERLVQVFAAERHQLESHRSRGDQASTEDLRIALQRYRSFFQRLLAVQ
jgi:hypothetical protein